MLTSSSQRVLLTGASGRLGSYLLRDLQERHIPVVAWSGATSTTVFGTAVQPMDLTDSESIVSAFREALPTVVIHTAALSGVTECNRDPDRAWGFNTQVVVLLAELANQLKAKLLFVSTDLVFDGECGWYRESDRPAPRSIYGQTKVRAEQLVISTPESVVVRLSPLYGATLSGRLSFFDHQVTAIRKQQRIELFIDEWHTPLELTTAAQGISEIALSDYRGILHMGGPERLSWIEMGQRLAKFLKLDASVIIPILRASTVSAKTRPRDTSLDSSLWRQLCSRLPQLSFEETLAQMGLS